MTTVAELKTEVDKLREELAAVRDITSAPSFKKMTMGTTAMLPADVTENDDGSITLGCRLRFLNPFDINTTGVGTITVLPDESLAAFLPLLGRGDVGLSPILTSEVLVNEIGPDDPLPASPFKLDKIDPGDANATPPEPPVYQLTVTSRQGQRGLPGTPVNLEALGNVYLSGGATTLLPGQTVVYRTPDGAPAGWYVEATRTTDFAVCTAFTPASGNAPNQVLGSLTLAQQSHARRCWVGGACQINPAANTANGVTHIDLIARLFPNAPADPSTGGIVVGFGQGLDTNQPFIANLWPTAAAAGGSAIIPAGQAGIVYLVAQQTNPTLSDWSTTMTHASFSALAPAIV